MFAVTIGQPGEVIERLKDFQIQVMESSEGVDGLRKIVHYRRDFVVVDLEIPTLDGFNLIKLMNVLDLKVPVLFTCQESRFKHRVKSMEIVFEFMERVELLFSLDDEFITRLNNFRLSLIRSGPPKMAPLTREEWSHLMAKPFRKRILIIDDDELPLNLLMGALKDANDFEVFLARNGLEGLKKSFIINPDLIISDILMPGIDGLALCQIFYMLGRNFPLVYLTSTSNETILEKARKLDGVLGLLQKRQETYENIRREVTGFLKLSDSLKGRFNDSYTMGEIHDLIKMRDEEGWLNEAV